MSESQKPGSERACRKAAILSGCLSPVHRWLRVHFFKHARFMWALTAPLPMESMPLKFGQRRIVVSEESCNVKLSQLFSRKSQSHAATDDDLSAEAPAAGSRDNEASQTPTPKRFLLACMPKSGSTYLSNLIGNLPGFASVPYVPAYEGREQELSEESILACAADYPNQIAQHHVRASDYTLYLLKKYQMRPIILVRNIFDAAVSVADHIHNEDRTSPMAYFDERIANSSLADRIDAVVDLVIPWYFNFYTSWWASMPDRFETYEDVILGGIERQLSFLQQLEIEADMDTLVLALTRAGEARANELGGLRFNVGKTGRGLEILTPDQVGRIKKLASHYPNVDFQKIGL